MRRIALMIALATLACGCQPKDANKNWNPEAEYPPWTYDAPFYYRPVEDLAAAETWGNGVDVYYSSSEYFFIRHPGGAQVRGTPRVAIWTTNAETRQWRLKGYYGLEQSHFYFKADQDGPQWIRFVGPAQGVSDVPPGSPHRVYVVDRQAPAVEVTIEKYVKAGSASGWYLLGAKPQVKLGMKKAPRISSNVAVSDSIRLRWKVTDANLVPDSVSFVVCADSSPYNAAWNQASGVIAPQGIKLFDIPPEAAQVGTIKFRVQATDKAGNVGIGVTKTLSVDGATASNGAIALLKAPVSTDPQPGWPKAGELLRGETNRTLDWLPQAVRDGQAVELQFSANDGKTWRGLTAGKPREKVIKWIVPAVNSKHCRLRLVALGSAGERIQLAQTARFTISTVIGSVQDSPRKLEADE